MVRTRSTLWALIGISIASMAVSSAAFATDSLIEGAKLCTRNLPRYERAYGIPTHLLSAIASTESGRYHSGLKLSVPWPWTINAEGKGYFFDSKQEAIAAVRRLQSQGISSIDVGCMQVNLHHHPQAFLNLDDAFEPERNVAYAASFLRTLYEEQKSWKSAAASYHSRTYSRGMDYVGKVYDRWLGILDKVRAARSQLAQSNTSPATPSFESPLQPAMLQLPPPPALKTVTPLASAAKPVAEKPQKMARASSIRMNSIRVTTRKDYAPRDSAILVMQPSTQAAPAAAPVEVADASAHIIRVADMKRDDSPKIVHIDRPESSRKQGPSFVFAE